MTDAADKAKEIATKMPRACAHARYIVVCDACIAAPIAAAIESAVQTERERAGKLVEAAKAVVPAINSSESLSNRKRDAFKAALQAYEVPHE